MNKIVLINVIQIFFVLIPIFFYPQALINIDFKFKVKKKIVILEISLENISKDTLHITGYYFKNNKMIYKGYCNCGYLDFINISGLNLEKEQIYFNENPPDKFQKFSPQQQKTIKFKYHIYGINTNSTCYFIFRVYNPYEKKGYKYLINLIYTSNLEVSKEIINRFGEP